MTKFLAAINGYKTYVGMGFAMTGDFTDQVVQGIWGVGVDSFVMNAGIDTASWFGLALGGVGFAHKIVKRRNGK